MPEPGDLSPGFFICNGRCFRLVYSPQIQSTHCSAPALWSGRWKDGKGKEHRAWACERHAGALDEPMRA
jgi:hypothetical protein